MNRREFLKSSGLFAAALALAPALQVLGQQQAKIHSDIIKAADWNADVAMNKLTTAIRGGRGSAVMLDNLGLRVKTSEIPAWSVMPRSARQRKMLESVLEAEGRPA